MALVKLESQLDIVDAVDLMDVGDLAGPANRYCVY
jgi:hypothetical protein